MSDDHKEVLKQFTIDAKKCMRYSEWYGEAGNDCIDSLDGDMMRYFYRPKESLKCETTYNNDLIRCISNPINTNCLSGAFKKYWKCDFDASRDANKL
jgi:hypothetical protein